MNEWFSPGVMGEGAALCAALYCGLVIGALYDVFSLLRLPFKSPWATGVLDGLFYALALAIAALSLLYINCATVRLYLFLGIGTGIYVYARFPGRLLRAAAADIRAKLTKKQLR